jgi:hypothetical protein
MSADNGFIIRRRNKRQFVLQQYSASAEDYPNINNPRSWVFDSLIDAVMKYTEITADPNFICEYGLTIKIEEITR